MLTSAAGFPPDDIHSSSISRSSVATISSMLMLPSLTILGFSGGTNTVTCALRERIACAPIWSRKNIHKKWGIPSRTFITMSYRGWRLIHHLPFAPGLT